MYTVALNLIRNHQRKKKPLILYSDPERVADERLNHSETPEKKFLIIQQQRILARFILDLRMNYREAIVLRFYQDLAFEEIAEIQSCSVSAAKMRVYRSLERLKDLMQNALNDG
jgi:RNA polymerase sigma-70 factor (ECF subfamily)